MLRPLRPVYARDFLRIAPHEVCFEDLEVRVSPISPHLPSNLSHLSVLELTPTPQAAQWTILRTFSLELNLPMPGALLSELRLASTPLLLLVPAEWMWEVVVEDVWWMLGLAVRRAFPSSRM